MTIRFTKTPAVSRTQPSIEADHLILRPLGRQDAALLHIYTSDRRVAEGTRSIPHPLTAAATQAYIDAAVAEDRDEDVWAIDGRPQGAPSFLGVVSLKSLDRNQSQIGYWVAPDFWHAGIASSAVKALLDTNPHRNKTVFAEVFQDNPVSARVLTNAGFDYIGDAEAHSLARHATVPTWTYLRKLA
ncbi:GNAT family N-acetyltransferase [Pararhodobacter zhoushanensis]|uniref:GNAT family N-acetyltransferase n=1 Tax=Pararhodobacter zhoushanensis TaxID=2479545 RepID=A0ABT3H0G2_9RHOB|nr:GNAT family N-acetyltransferase [Pararhodobacter zhoushanensis]MCW1933274.1 GNAT family N-acetyltransferase [Pararhodobacter zhoushanensis]